MADETTDLAERCHDVRRALTHLLDGRNCHWRRMIRVAAGGGKRPGQGRYGGVRAFLVGRRPLDVERGTFEANCASPAVRSERRTFNAQRPTSNAGDGLATWSELLAI